jgi:hypothetical protein
MSPWETVLLALGGNALLLTVLGVLARSLLSQYLAKDLSDSRLIYHNELNWRQMS